MPLHRLMHLRIMHSNITMYVYNHHIVCGFQVYHHIHELISYPPFVKREKVTSASDLLWAHVQLLN